LELPAWLNLPRKTLRRKATADAVPLKEATEYIAVTDRTLRQMIADGRLTGYRSGSRLVRVDLNELDAAMQSFGGATR
jgi:excisionase family DNA binding protein